MIQGNIWLSRLMYTIICIIWTLFIIFFITGCGHEGYYSPGECIEVYSQEFCDSIRGAQGEPGESGEDGIGVEGPSGRDGLDGEDGESIVGPEGPQGIAGEDGSDGLDAIVEIIDPCGKEADYDEILVRFSDNNIYAVYVDKKDIFFTRLDDGEYITTDGTECKFTIEDNEVYW